MSKILLPVLLAAPVILPALLLASCAGGPGKIVLTPEERSGLTETPYTITDHKNKANGREMPEWVNSFFEGGAAAVEALDAYHGRYAFIGRNEGNNFAALSHWAEDFSPELDFPRLAAARIEARFSSAAPLPDEEYGSFYETLVRVASDAFWVGAERNDDYWIRKFYFVGEDESERETWEFLILVTMDKMLFALQLEEVFQDINPRPAPTKDQAAAISRVKERFSEGF